MAASKRKIKRTGSAAKANLNVASYLEPSKLENMSVSKLFSHFTLFFLFLVILMIVAFNEAKTGWGRVLGLLALFLAAAGSAIPWIRDSFRH